MKHRIPKGLALCSLLLCVLAALALSSINCGGGPALPPGWTSHTYKLTGHPEAFAGGEDAYKKYRARKTIDDDTREGFNIGAVRELAFDVDLPSMGSVKFAYGYGPGLQDYGGEITIGLRAKGEGFDEVIGRWDMEPIPKGENWRWVDANVAIYPDAAGDAKLTFYVQGLTRHAPEGAIFLGNPSIVAPKDKKKRKRVVWISIDTLRADHLGCYGYERATSPNIDALAKEATVFDRCISECPWTLPSYASMLTGRYPTITGATTNVRYLPETERTLAQLISTQDMATLSVYNVHWVGSSSGLDRGFDSAKMYSGEYADKSFDTAREWMLNHADEDCFVFLHIYDPHLPYKPKEEFRDTFDPDYEGRYKYEKTNYDGLMTGNNVMTDTEKHHVEALYDEDILGCDHDTGEFLDFLRKNDLYNDSLIIINSDHGEEFWEHGGFAHGHTLYDEILRIPLIIRGPGFEKGQRVSQMVAAFDVFPTILEWLDIEVPREISAISLSDVLANKVKPESRMHLSEQLYFGMEQKGVSTDQYRYILHTIDRAEELYDVTDDPGMFQDVSTDRRAASRNFRYFATEYTLNEGVGWHARIYRTPGRGANPQRAGEKYEGKIVSPSGFAEVVPTKLGDGDVFQADGNELRFSISIATWDDKGFDFRTNDENDMVQFEILTDGDPETEQFVFLGPEKIPAPSTNFNLSILDPMFGLGTPLFGPQGGKHHGLYLWGNSETLREESTPEIDDRTREELKSLGYLH